MQPITYGLLRRARRRFVSDYETDPYLRYILVLATVLAGFWFWHRVPQFATHDAFGRLYDPMAVLGAIAVDSQGASLERAISTGPRFGVTFYLYAITLIPAVLYALATGQFDAFAPLYWSSGPIDRLARWQMTPEWLWTSSLLVARLLSVLFAVGCVYLTYRIGVAMRDRLTGRLAAVLLTFTFGFLVVAHEVGEDIPMLFVLLLVVYLSLRYAETGDETVFLAGCVLGGLAISLKFTAGTTVFFLGAAYLLHTRHADDWRNALYRPRLLGIGLAFATATIVISFPTVIVGGVDELVARVQYLLTEKSTSPRGHRIWWWLLRGYLSGLGLPLSIAAVGGVIASVSQLRDRRTSTNGVVLLLVGLFVYLAVYARWDYIRTHHLLPTFPLLCLLVAAALVHLHDYDRRLARPLIAVLVITSGAYAVGGDLGYAAQPWDETTEWLQLNDPESSIEVYMKRNDILSNTAIPHQMNVYWYGYGTKYLSHGPNTVSGEDTPTRTEWMLDMPERCPDYIQLGYRNFEYLASHPQGKRASYIRELYSGDAYPYTVVATFGPQPQFDSQPMEFDPLELLQTGVYPWTVNAGDAQDLRSEQYTVILKRTESCKYSDNTARRVFVHVV
jgi:hypothetical protein